MFKVWRRERSCGLSSEKENGFYFWLWNVRGVEECSFSVFIRFAGIWSPMELEERGKAMMRHGTNTPPFSWFYNRGNHNGKIVSCFLVYIGKECQMLSSYSTNCNKFGYMSLKRGHEFWPLTCTPGRGNFFCLFFRIYMTIIIKN